MPNKSRWIPASILAAGCLIQFGFGPNRVEPQKLRESLSSLPTAIGDYRSYADTTLSVEERQAAGMDEYLYRYYRADSTKRFTLYVGFYEKQVSGKAIHSPKNCLPGGGWQELDNRTEKIAIGNDTIAVNRWLIQQGQQKALVFYWYQGRGRVSASEYLVKWLLLKDTALLQRTDEALVRIVIPITRDMSSEQAAAVGRQAAATLIPEITERLPAA